VGAGAGGAAALLAGLPLLGVGAVVAIGWFGGVALVRVAQALRPRTARPAAPALPNPYAVPQPWRDLVADVLRSRERFAETARGAEPGPLQEHLRVLEARLDDGVHESWLVAVRGTELAGAVARLDPGEIHRRLTLVSASLRTADPTAQATARLRDTAGALQSQLASVTRIEAVAEDARSRLQLLAAHLGEAVAKAVELSVGQGAGVDLEQLSASVEAAVGELETLRRAIAETEAETQA
jgi:hypothetical protein